MDRFLFSELGSQIIGDEIELFMSSGYDREGFGQAFYRLTTSTISSRYCGQSANKRWFELAENPIFPEMMGARGDGDVLTGGGHDDRVPWQCALDYAARNQGITVKGRLGACYKLVATKRLSDVLSKNADGMHLVIDSKNKINLDASGSAFLCRGFGDVDHLLQWQTINGHLWRGHGIYIRGGTDERSRTGDHTIQIGKLDGGAGYSGVSLDEPIGVPADLYSGAGWDVTHKGVCIEPDAYTGKIEIRSSQITRFRGELVYQGGPNCQGLSGYNNWLHDGEADGWSSSASGYFIGNKVDRVAFAGIECGLYGNKTYIFSNNAISNCDKYGVSLTAIDNAEGGSVRVSDNTIENARNGAALYSTQRCVLFRNRIVDSGWLSTEQYPGSFRALTLASGDTPLARYISMSDTIIAENKLLSKARRLATGIKCYEVGNTRSDRVIVKNNEVGYAVHNTWGVESWYVPFDIREMKSKFPDFDFQLSNTIGPIVL